MSLNLEGERAAGYNVKQQDRPIASGEDARSGANRAGSAERNEEPRVTIDKALWGGMVRPGSQVPCCQVLNCVQQQRYRLDNIHQA